jgi:hypothetical protein
LENLGAFAGVNDDGGFRGVASNRKDDQVLACGEVQTRWRLLL